LDGAPARTCDQTGAWFLAAPGDAAGHPREPVDFAAWRRLWSRLRYPCPAWAAGHRVREAASRHRDPSQWMGAGVYFGAFAGCYAGVGAAAGAPRGKGQSWRCTEAGWLAGHVSPGRILASRQP